MASIRDFGLARGKVRKASVRPALYGAPVRLLIRALRLARTGDLEIVTAPVFRLLALDGERLGDKGITAVHGQDHNPGPRRALAKNP
jgi:hypothetical protein